MTEDREKILKQIYETPLEDLLKTTPKESKKQTFKRILKDMFLWRIKFVGAILGVTEENIGSLSVRDDTNQIKVEEEEKNKNNEKSCFEPFKESYKFDPSEAYMRRMQEKAYNDFIGLKEEDIILTGEEYWRKIQEDAYFKMIDGKGDDDYEKDR